MNKFEKLSSHVFVTKLAGFEHTKYIQGNQTHEKINQDDVPLVQGKNIRNGIFINNHEWYIPKEISDCLVRSKLDKPCILIPYVGSNLGEIGIFYHEYDCHMASNIAKVELIDDHFDLEYLKYYLQSDIGQAYLFQAKQGSAQPNITMESIRETLILDIDLKIQKQISNILKLLDDKIQLNNKINAELESMAKTLYDYWFLQFEFPNEEGKPYKSSGGKMVWNEELKREIPEGWEVTTIGDVTVCHDSKRIPLTGNEREEIKGNIPYYGATGIMGYVNRPIFDGDYVLVAEDGSVMNEKGNPIIQRVSGKIWVNNHAHVLEPIKNYSCKLLMMILKDIPVAAIKTGSIQMKINQENLNKVKILDIPNEIKKQINKQFETIDKMILENNKENQELASLRDFLLPLLMNGQVGFKE